MSVETIDGARAFADMRDFLIEAGAFAKAKQKGVECHYKDGEQAVTETDLAVSRLAQERLGGWLARDGHVLLDEESIADKGTPAEIFARTRYQWILDPIDGTAGYALGRGMWGVSLALWENGRPLLGGIILPVQRVLMLCDGARSWIVEERGTAEESERDLRAAPMAVNSQTFVESYQADCLRWGADIFRNRAWVNTPESAVQGFYCALTGRAAASVAMPMYSIWDIAGAASLARCGGFAVRDFDTGAHKETYGAGDFKDNWKLARPLVFGPSDTYAAVREAIRASAA